jgi:D-alanyl-D-alanine carboxypeptidase (penicillin-binding protein 5/6)
MRRVPAAAAALALVLVPGAGVARADESPGPPVVAAKSWLVADLTTGSILAAKHPHRRLPPASTLKTLTAVTLLPRLGKTDVYRVQWEDAAVEGSAVGIVPDATYTVDELFYGLMLPSGNDAAHALANAAGGMHKTVRMMAEEAQRLGAVDTVVRNPSGLDAPGQVSSAYDLALFAKAGLARRDFRRYVSTVTTAFPAEMPKRPGKERHTYQIYNQNPLLLHGYRGVVGVKTGYTTLAGRTFVGAAHRDGHLLVVTLMASREPTELAAERLLDWGFDHVDDLPQAFLVGATEAERPVAVAGPGDAAHATSVEPSTAGADLGLGLPAALAVAAMTAAALLGGALGVRAYRSRAG